MPFRREPDRDDRRGRLVQAGLIYGKLGEAQTVPSLRGVERFMAERGNGTS